jgi:hypothetical protein
VPSAHPVATRTAGRELLGDAQRDIAVLLEATESRSVQMEVSAYCRSMSRPSLATPAPDSPWQITGCYPRERSPADDLRWSSTAPITPSQSHGPVTAASPAFGVSARSGTPTAT